MAASCAEKQEARRRCNFSATVLCYPAKVVETAINSFVLRFVQESVTPGGMSPDGGSGTDAEWHGVIRHVQSNAELRFVQMDEALAFIATYVPLPPASIANPPAGDSV